MVGWLGFGGFLVWLVNEDHGKTEPVMIYEKCLLWVPGTLAGLRTLHWHSLKVCLTDQHQAQH